MHRISSARNPSAIFRSSAKVSHLDFQRGTEAPPPFKSLLRSASSPYNFQLEGCIDIPWLSLNVRTVQRRLRVQNEAVRHSRLSLIQDWLGCVSVPRSLHFSAVVCTTLDVLSQRFCNAEPGIWVTILDMRDLSSPRLGYSMRLRRLICQSNRFEEKGRNIFPSQAIGVASIKTSISPGI